MEMVSNLQLPPSQGMRIVTVLLMLCTHLNRVISISLEVDQRVNYENCIMDTIMTLGGWTNLTVITENNNETHSIQLKFSQMLHGIYGCNCSSDSLIIKIEVKLEKKSESDVNTCTSVNITRNDNIIDIDYCGLIITKVISCNGTGDEFPGDIIETATMTERAGTTTSTEAATSTEDITVSTVESRICDKVNYSNYNL